MTKGTKKRISKLNEYIKRREFVKIRDLLKLLEDASLSAEEHEMLRKAKTLLKNLIRIEVRKYLAVNRTVERMKIEIIMRMDDDFIAEMRSVIRNSMLKRYLNEFQTNSTCLTKLSNIKEALNNLCEMFDKVRFGCSNIPKEWNLEGDFMFYCVLHVKEILFESYIGKWSTKEYVEALKHIIEFEKKNTKYYFSKECCYGYKEGEYANKTCSGGDNTLKESRDNRSAAETERKSSVNDVKNVKSTSSMGKFESLVDNKPSIDKKHSDSNERNGDISRNQDDMNCANKNLTGGIVKVDVVKAATQLILFDRDQVLTSKPNIKTNFIVLYDAKQIIVSDFCRHRKMLSHLLLPNINLLINDLFLPVKRVAVNQKCVEMNLIASFIQFFRELGNVLMVVRHFESASVHELFIHEANSTLCMLLAHVTVPYSYKDLVVILNTLYFVETTFLELVEKIRKWGTIDHDVSTYVRKLESKVTTRIESILKVIFRRNVKKKFAFSNEFIEMLKKEVLVLDRIEFNESVFQFLFETLFSLLFSKMVKFKMEPQLAELLIEEIGEIRLFLEEQWPKLPLIDVMENYLKIFVCTTDNVTVFVTCFNQLNNNLFDFKNIIEALEDSSKNKLLVREYENQKNKMIKYESCE
ncbi:hypothetical protein VCUG_00063 [Vavraia culicis subsp. floridensis]|uniref:Uncharacterized protein n=1 Tax=Vavraia culicis (isolate floridensis) TaxID=948595 RepID=L2GXV5_VAVCU|nr:uncharacterized protein VCUG_00063 [Vavraia culicis subsp. floridensis]ELA48454.1 hypothetical protein VCUG_00063 [Vavraia culicis subsp. floridensis]